MKVNDSQDIALGDADGDGDLDVFFGNYEQQNRLYRNDGGSFSMMPIGEDDSSTNAVALVDLDGDTALDIVEANGSSSPGLARINKFYRNDGMMTPGFTGMNIGTDDDNSLAIALGDADRDGDLDVFVATADASTGVLINKLYLNTNGGFPAMGMPIRTDTDDSRGIALGDANEDGNIDVFVANFGSSNRQPNKVYLGNGDGTFGEGSNITDEADGSQAIALGDADGDGDLDVFVANSGTGNRVYINDIANAVTPGFTGRDIGTDTHEGWNRQVNAL